MKPIRIMAASGMLGYGFTEEAFKNGLAMGLDLIACDAGSADPGPYYFSLIYTTHAAEDKQL